MNLIRSDDKPSQDTIASLPDDAVVNSFGCGNPLAYSDVSEGEVVLDLGSGGGIDVFLAAKQVGPDGKVIGVDMTPEMIERARQNADSAGFDQVEFRLGRLEDLPVDSHSLQRLHELVVFDQRVQQVVELLTGNLFA